MATSISVITPVFNRERLVANTIRSVMDQTYTDWELIIVDDGSSDGTVEIIKSFTCNDARIKLVGRHRDPKGACTCRNIGIEKATGKYLLFLDSDDLLEPICLEQRVKAMEENPDISFGIFPTLIFDNKPYDLNRYWNIDKPISDILRHLYLDAICQTSGVLIRKDIIRQTSGWSEDVSMWQDIDFFLRMHIMDVPYRKFFDLPADMHHRVNAGSLSRNDYFAVEKIEGRKRVFQKAVMLLEQYGKQTLIPESKFMAGAIIGGYIRTRIFKEAQDVIQWAHEHDVLKKEDSAIWNKYIFYQRLRLYKFPILKRKMENKLKHFQKESSIGLIPYR